MIRAAASTQPLGGTLLNVMINRILTATAFTLLLAYIASAQGSGVVEVYLGPDANHVSINRIRRVTKSAALKNRPDIEIELDEPRNEARAAMDWCLHIGDLRFAWPDHRPANHTMIFTISTQAWKKLRNGDSMSLSWGCQPDSSTRPFAHLDKKWLRK